MNKYEEIFVRKLKDEGLEYTFEDDVFFLRIAGDNYRDYQVVISIRDDGDDMPLMCIYTENIACFKGKEALGFALCNSLNDTKNSGIVKFCVENGAELTATLLTFFSEKHFYEQSYLLLNSFCSAVDNSYPQIMKSLYA